MSDATADTATTQADTATADTATDSETKPDTDWEKEATKWQALAQKHENRAKANATAAKELDALKQTSMSDTEKAVAEAEARGRADALTTVGARLVEAEVRVASAGRTVDVDALLDGLDRSKFLTEDGEPDSEAIQAWVDRIAPADTETQEETGPLSALDLGQGTRNTDPNMALNGDPLFQALKSAVGAK